MIDSIPASGRASWRAHRVTEGDTVASVATKYRVTVKSVLAANPETGTALEPGDFVVVPSAAPPVRRARPAVKTRRKAQAVACLGRTSTSIKR
jgi:LysM repeat protein